MPTISINGAPPREMTAEERAGILSEQQYVETTAWVVRMKRDERLVKEVDPLVTNPLRWADLTEDKQAEWTQYRRDLLDITDQAGFPNDITWPTKPEGAN